MTKKTKDSDLLTSFTFPISKGVSSPRQLRVLASLVCDIVRVCPEGSLTLNLNSTGRELLIRGLEDEAAALRAELSELIAEVPQDEIDAEVEDILRGKGEREI